MSQIKDIGLELLAVLFPPACVACHRVEGVTSQRLGLCSTCQRQLGIFEGNACSMQCGSLSVLRRIVSRWAYEPPFDSVIHGLKFGHLEFLGRDLADGLHPIIEDIVQEIDVVVPIPLHWIRFRSRGFNQAEAIARPLAESLGLPIHEPLRRRRQTTAQATLNREARRHNLLSAFVPARRHNADIVGKRVLLVDDVLTTGATLEAGARSLLSIGVRSVIGATAGRTPRSAVDSLARDRNRLRRTSLTEII